MKVTTESLASFVGGEAEIQNQVEDYLYRGEIAEVRVEEGNLLIKFAWFAKNRGGPFGGEKGRSEDWDNQSNLDYEAGLNIYFPSDIGNGRIAFNSPVTNELVTLFPADGSKMNPENIHGLHGEVWALQAEKFRKWDESR